MNEYSNKSVLITGCTGFFGSNMFNRLNYHARIFRADHNKLNTYLEYYKYDYIFHFAPTPIEPVIRCAEKSNAKILYASSGGVYGGIEKKVNENCPVNPKTDYAKEKVRSERILQDSELDYCIVRLFAFCGQGMKNTFAITNFIEDVKNDRPINVLYGKSVRTYMYIDDAIDWLLKLMLCDNGIYNVGSEKEISIIELAKKISKYGNHGVVESGKPFVDPAPYYVPDCSKAHDLGLEQHFSLNYGIERMME
jgi:nucleoside-diphosphate-sugar epimerase